jgi:hypothetical protein
MGVIGLLVYRMGPDSLRPDVYRAIWLLAVVWLPMGLFFFFGKVGVRCSDFDMALPVHARRLWLAHAVAVFVAGLAIALTSIGIVSLHNRFRQRLSEGAFPDLGASGLIVPTVAGLALAVVILQSRDPSLRTIRRSPAALWTTTTVFLGVFVVMVVLENVSVFWALLPVIVALWIGSRFVRRVPGGFTLVPAEPERAGDPRSPGGAKAGDYGWAATLQERERRGVAARWRVELTLLNVLSRGIAPGALIKVSLVPVLGVPILLAWGVFASGVLFDGTFSELDFSILTGYLLVAFIGGLMEQLYFPYTVPISRRRLFATIVLPGMIVLGVGYAVGLTWKAIGTTPTAGVVYRTEWDESVFPPYGFGTPMVRVPIEYCRVARDGEVPEIRSPWGETQKAFSVDVSRLEDARLYTPFATPEGSSIEFVAWQIGRAVQAVHGVVIPPEEIRQRYLATDDEGEVMASSDAGLTLLQDYPELRSPHRISVTPIAWLVIAGGFLLLTALYTRVFRATIGLRGRKWAFFGILFAALAVHLAQFLSNILLTKPYVSVGILKIWLGNLTRDVPGGAFVIWVVCGGIVAGCYWLAQRQFDRMEISLPCSGARE